VFDHIGDRSTCQSGGACARIRFGRAVGEHPGYRAISAIQRPSSSRSTSIMSIASSFAANMGSVP